MARMTFNDTSSLPAYLASRRSGKPRDMVAPGPDDAQIRAIISLAMRTPDHGKLNPWRVVMVQPEDREALAAQLVDLYRADKPEAGRIETDSIAQYALQAPCLLVVLSSPRAHSKVPLWEQQISAGAFAMNLAHAAHAHGFVAGWLSGWATEHPGALALFGESHEKIIGYMYIGTSGKPQQERPRPALDDVLSVWNPRN